MQQRHGLAAVACRHTRENAVRLIERDVPFSQILIVPDPEVLFAGFVTDTAFAALTIAFSVSIAVTRAKTATVTSTVTVELITLSLPLPLPLLLPWPVPVPVP